MMMIILRTMMMRMVLIIEDNVDDYGDLSEDVEGDDSSNFDE